MFSLSLSRSLFLPCFIFQETEHQNFADVQKFLTWRKRQVIVFAAGMSHNIDMYKKKYHAFEASLETTQNKLFNQVRIKAALWLRHPSSTPRQCAGC